MGRLTFDNNGVPQFTHEGMIMYCSSMAMADCIYELENRLADYKDAEERGLLIWLPCKVGSHVWRVWITDGRKPEITEHDMSDLLHIVQWIGKFGKTVFLTREEAEAVLAMAALEREKED